MPNSSSFFKFILVYTFLFCTTLFAQTRYEFDVSYGFGSSELSFNSVPGFAISIYPIENFGFSAGIEHSWRWRTRISEQSGVNPIVADSEGDSLIFKYAIDKYSEKLMVKMLQFPIMFKYSNNLYYTAAGIKIGVVRNASANINYEGLKTEGYYPQYNLTLDAPHFQGFGLQADSSSKIDISSKTLLMLALEGGAKIEFSKNFALLAGIFADYSLNRGFKRTLLPVVERVENSTGASVVVSDNWKSWKPWSVGFAVKFSFSFESGNEYLEEPEVVEPPPSNVNHSIAVQLETPPPPIPLVAPPNSQVKALPPEPKSLISPLPSFLLNRTPNFVFHYPEERTSPSDSVHLALISKISDTLATNQKLKLHCVGYSENLRSESAEYEIALQRVIRIRYILVRFYGMEESRIFIYSQGSKRNSQDSGNSDYRKVECFVL